MRIAILPARGGSVRIPRKNIREFRGKPMIQWPIEAAQASGLFDQIVVSTDDAEIAELAETLGCLIHGRPKDDGETGTQEIVARVLAWTACALTDEVCVIYPCSPTLLAQDLLVSHEAWEIYTRMQTAYSFIEGCLYWGHVGPFLWRVPLDGNSVESNIPERFIDINTESDWIRAESMFDAMHA